MTDHDAPLIFDCPRRTATSGPPRGAAPLTDAEMTRLFAALGGLLGATPLTTETRP
jgi:hypothetical protein